MTDEVKTHGSKRDVHHGIYTISNELYKLLIMKRKQPYRRSTEPYADGLHVPEMTIMNAETAQQWTASHWCCQKEHSRGQTTTRQPGKVDLLPISLIQGLIPSTILDTEGRLRNVLLLNQWIPWITKEVKRETELQVLLLLVAWCPEKPQSRR